MSRARSPPHHIRQLPPWRLDYIIGRGRFGTVFLEKVQGKEIESPELWAVKRISRTLSDFPAKRYEAEIQNFRVLSKYEWFVKFISSYQDADFVYIAMEYMAIGDVSKTFTNDYRWNESDTKAVIEQVLHGLVAMHKESITHRDLKPENIFLCLPAGTAQVIHVKIGDFGASKHVPLSSTSTFLKTSIGTVGYMAPEMLDTSIAKTNEVDIWSLGCILFRMFTGSLLFKDLSELYKYALSPPPQTLGLENIGFSAPCVNFLNDVLQASPEDRPSAQACLERDWIMNEAPGLQYTIGNDLYTNLSMVGVGAPNIDTFRQTVAEDKEDEGAGLSREDI